MKYSVVATTFNDSLDIIKYLEDIINQSYPPDEIVIADGGSKDDTVEKIKQFSFTSSITIRVVEKGRLNISQGYNEAIKVAANDMIGITGVGNYYDQFFFEELVNVIEKKGLDYVYSPIRGYNANDFAKRYNISLLHGDIGNCLDIASNHGALVKKKIFEDLNFFYEKFIYAGEDAEFYSLVKKNGYKGECVKTAKMYWKTPTSWHEFLKQIRVYTIADLQIHSKKQWRRLRKRVIKLFMLAIVIGAGVIIVGVQGNVISKVLYGLAIVSVMVIKRRQLNPFRILNSYLPIFYTIKYKKYMDDEHAVRR